MLKRRCLSKRDMGLSVMIKAGLQGHQGGKMLTEFDRDRDGPEILARLATVLDPELDDSISELGFVHAVRVQGGHADVELQLPTSWCAVNFAFIMAEDVRKTLLQVEGIAKVTVRLGDHCAAAEIE